MRKRNLLVFLLLTGVWPVTGLSAQDAWKITAGQIEPPSYYGITVANGMLGLVSSPEPLKISRVVLGGLYDIYGITSWLSDVLSYSRLLALGLATGVIAQVVNSMASMMGDGILGAIFFIVVFIIGHTLNLAINLLGAYVHTNRLQYVEFFGKFYEGGGRPFEPFKQNTKYIRIKEDI